MPHCTAHTALHRPTLIAQTGLRPLQKVHPTMPFKNILPFPQPYVSHSYGKTGKLCNTATLTLSLRKRHTTFGMSWAVFAITQILQIALVGICTFRWFVKSGHL